MTSCSILTVCALLQLISNLLVAPDVLTRYALLCWYV